MGQKANPIGMRLGVNRTWKSRWFAKKNYADLLREDLTIRKYIETKLARAGISDVVIERKADKVVVNVKTARPGIVIGRKGIEVERLNKELEHLTSKEIRINIEEVKRIELNSQLVAEHIAKQLEKRVGFRRAMRKAIESAMRMGAQGIKIKCAGRLGGSEMARVAEQHEGRVPLHTLRADIDFARSTAKTTHGTVGVKVWIFKGEKLGRPEDADEAEDSSSRPQRGRRGDFSRESAGGRGGRGERSDRGGKGRGRGAGGARKPQSGRRPQGQKDRKAPAAAKAGTRKSGEGE